MATSTAHRKTGGSGPEAMAEEHGRCRNRTRTGREAGKGRPTAKGCGGCASTAAAPHSAPAHSFVSSAPAGWRAPPPGSRALPAAFHRAGRSAEKVPSRREQEVRLPLRPRQAQREIEDLGIRQRCARAPRYNGGRPCALVTASADRPGPTRSPRCAACIQPSAVAGDNRTMVPFFRAGARPARPPARRQHRPWPLLHARYPEPAIRQWRRSDLVRGDRVLRTSGAGRANSMGCESGLNPFPRRFPQPGLGVGT
jgi:hypothetical protein